MHGLSCLAPLMCACVGITYTDKFACVPTYTHPETEYELILYCAVVLSVLENAGYNSSVILMTKMGPNPNVKTDNDREQTPKCVHPNLNPDPPSIWWIQQFLVPL